MALNEEQSSAGHKMRRASRLTLEGLPAVPSLPAATDRGTRSSLVVEWERRVAAIV